MMSRSAKSDRVLVPPAEISELTVMSPDIEPSPAVLTVTLLVARAVTMVAALTFAAVEPEVTVEV